MPYTGDNFVRVFGRKMHSKTEKSMRSTLGFSKLNKSLSCSLTQDTSLEGFMGMHFKFNGIDITGQTILRNIGTGKRNSNNLFLIKRAIGCPQIPQSAISAFFSDPDNAMEVLTYFPEMDLKTRPFIKFYNVTIRSPLFTGNASTFINMATAQYRQIGVSPSKAFYYLMLSAGIDRRDLTLEPEQLKEVLDSSGFDFRTRVPHVHEFRAMKFRSPYLINTAKNKGEITGQSLLQRYTERGKGQTIQIMGRILKEAGYPHPNPNPDLRSPDAIRTILDSAKKQVDWAAIRYNELKYLKFDSPIFKGIGVTWLKRTGDTTSRNMRRLLKKVGITNKPSKRWANRIR